VQVLYPRCSGLDVHKATIAACAGLRRSPVFSREIPPCLKNAFWESRRFSETLVTEWRRRDRRKLSWDDYNPAHVESGRLESFPVSGAFRLRATSVAEWVQS
jgi:hypothetical protein